MKAEGLMVGDYVRIAKEGLCIPRGTIVIVRGVDADNRLAEKNLIGSATCLPINDEDRTTGGIWVEYLEPIPLTPEILEKNGFEKVYDKYKLPNYRIKWNSYTDLFFTVFTGVDGYWNHVGLGVIIGGVPATLDYVHQLQHALKLCGINKEIIL